VYHSTVLPELPATPPQDATIPPENPPISRGRAAAEVLLCSGYPTQLLIGGGLAAAGFEPGSPGALSPAFVFLLSSIDTVVLLSLVFVLLRQSNDRAADVFLGGRSTPSEISAGVLWLPAVFLAVVLAQLVIRAFAPALHNVESSPFMPLLQSPLLIAGFVVLVLIAGGVREELQRAFLLHRFRRLGGRATGVVITSVAFGLGHTVQGWDAAIITGVLGAVWGTLYLMRGSVVATVTNHALFNVAQIAIAYAGSRMTQVPPL
jgi:membrane protease YdiL (CAAX protease family)